MRHTSTPRRIRKTFSLTPSSVSYLETLRRERRSKSTSALLEELIRRVRETREMERISASITSYYDSLSDEQVAEDRAWGQFALSQFPREEKP